MKYGRRPLFHGTKNIYIADLHGENTKFQALLNRITGKVKLEDYRLVFLGDLVGKGAELYPLLQTIVALKNEKYFIEGNWENYFKQFLNPRFENHNLTDFPKVDYIQQFPVKTFKELNELFKKEGFGTIFNNMIPYFETENVVATHGPLKLNILNAHFDKENPEGILDELYFLKCLFHEFTDKEDEDIHQIDKLMICGHQPNFQKFDKILEYRKKPTRYPKRIFLDCGGAGTNNNIPIFAYIEDQDLIV